MVAHPAQIPGIAGQLVAHGKYPQCRKTGAQIGQGAESTGIRDQPVDHQQLRAVQPPKSRTVTLLEVRGHAAFGQPPGDLLRIQRIG